LLNPIKILQKDRFTAKYSPSNHEPPPSLITSGELEVHEPNSSSPVVITSSRDHDLNGTQHKFGARFHLFTTIHSVSENENICHFSLSCNYETYADRFVCLTSLMWR